MTLILTFLGKGGTGRTTLAIAAGKAYAAQGQKTLLLSQDTSPALGFMLQAEVRAEPQALEPNLWVQSLRTTQLLEQNWEQLKDLEGQYLRSPFFKSVYGQELGILPGMDSALALNYLRELSQSQTYDVILYDGLGSQDTLRMLAMPDILGWYTRRFRQVFLDSDLGKTLLPFVQPVASAVLSVNWSEEVLTEPTQKATNLLDQGKAAVADPTQVAAYLVTTEDPVTQATARYLWGVAQQVGLTVGGVLHNPGADRQESSPPGDTPLPWAEQFAPLAIVPIPRRSGNNWQPLQEAILPLTPASSAPRALTLDLAKGQIRLFLPGFEKKQVKLTQYGPELTIEAGDQRRNILLPPTLAGKGVIGAKFADSYLTITLG
jgi:anion-transporting  ArsA/GET3 family ATPase